MGRTTQALVNAVKRGAEMLDATDPGWAHKVDIDRLKLCDEGECLLGQLWGIGKVGGYDWQRSFFKAHGFNASGADYDRLRTLWLVEIKFRTS